MVKIEKEKLEIVVKESYSFREVLEKLGYNYDDRTFGRNLERQIHRFNIDISHFKKYIKKDRYDKEKLIELVNNKKTLKDILLELELLVISPNYTTLKKKLEEYNIDYTKLEKYNRISSNNEWNKEELEISVKKSKNQRDVLLNMNLRAAGGNFKTLRKYLDLYNINTSHFVRINYISNIKSKIKLDDILIKESTYSTTHLKNRLYKEGLKERKCEMCGQGEEWNGMKISLILDHINGEHFDNRIENLRIVCPNCNAGLDTHCGKNKHKKRKDEKEIEKRIKYNDKNYTDKQIEQYISSRKVERPSYDILKKEVEESSYCAVGRKYGVSDNAIRKWLKQTIK